MKLVKRILMGVLLSFVVLVALSAVRNLGLPTESKVVDRMSAGDKARIAEFQHLLRELGGDAWPGFGEREIPVILYNEAYAFLVNYPGTPPDGWVKVPAGEQRGGPWVQVPGDTFQGKTYYRQRLDDPQITPESFTVRVGGVWVATLQIYEFAAIDFYSGFKEQLPGFLRPVFPYRLFWRLLIPNAEVYVGALVHESFHAFQGELVPDRFAAAERAVAVEASYPWEEGEGDETLEEELTLLYQAVQAENRAEMVSLTKAFLAQRQGRRALLGLTEDQVRYENQREWLEGLAKYVELTLQENAAEDEGYTPAALIEADPEFEGYSRTEQYLTRQQKEVTRMAAQGETRFYYTGYSIARLLDALSPGWKETAFDPGVYLEDLLARAVE